MLKKTDVSPQYISYLERGVVGIFVEKLKNLCVVLGVSSDEILFANIQAKSSAAFFEKISILRSEEHTSDSSHITRSRMPSSA